MKVPTSTYLQTDSLESSFDFSSILEQSVILDDIFKLKYTPSSPSRTLDSTGVKDSFYSNSIGWISDNILAVCMQDKLYGYDYEKRSVSLLRCLRDNNEDFINQTTFSCIAKQNSRRINNQGGKDPSHRFAYGLTDGKVRLRDLNKLRNEIGFFQPDSKSPVNAICWKDNILVAGYNNGKLFFFDFRSGLISQSSHHESKICTLKFDLYGQYLACASTDNTVSIWCEMDEVPRQILKESKSIVKGLAWCEERRNHLFTGSTTPENKIRLYSINVSEDKMLKSEIYVNSGISSLNYCNNSKSIISTHGIVDDFSVQEEVLNENNSNCIKSWNGTNFEFEGVIGSHSRRILSSVYNEERNLLVSLSSDENMKFWKLI